MLPLLCSALLRPLELPPAHPSIDMELVEQAQRRPPKWSEVVRGACCGGKHPCRICHPTHCSAAATSPLAEGQSMDPTSLGSFPPLPALPQPHLAQPRMLSPIVAVIPIPALHQAKPSLPPSMNPLINMGMELSFLSCKQLSSQRLGCTNLPHLTIQLQEGSPGCLSLPGTGNRASAFGLRLADLPRSPFPEG